MAQTCCFCGRGTRETTLHKCPNPRCANSICERHGLLYEVADEFAVSHDYYCSRQCRNEVQRRSLPYAKELIFAALVLLVAIPIYLYVVSLFT
jgi:hypothetical protein